MKFIKNKKGFSLLELLSATAIVAGLSLISASAMLSFKEAGQGIQKTVSQKTDKAFLEQILYQEINLGNIDISYGIMNIPSDVPGKFFLDYYPDYPSTLIAEADKKRTVTLDQNGDKIMFLTYSAGEYFKRISVLRTFHYTYNDLFGGLVPKSATFKKAYLVEELNKGGLSLYKTNRLILFYTPVWLRKEQPVNMEKFPKKPAFLTYVGGNLGVERYNKLASYFRNSIVTPGKSGVYTSITDFFNKNHLISGQDVVFAGLVKILIFQMQDSGLYRCLVTLRNDSLNCNSSNRNAQLLAENLKLLKFEREDVSNTILKISFEFKDVE